jgi:hypothetical protein
MSHGPGRLQRAILELMQQYARHQRTPQRDHWRVRALIDKTIRADPDLKTGKVRPLTSRQMADARKRIHRACDSLVAFGLVVKVGDGWELPPETPAEAKVRRKGKGTYEKWDQEFYKRKAAEEAWERQNADRIARAKLVKRLAKILGKLGSSVDNEVIMAAQQAERVRAELSCNWEDLLVRHPK